MNHHCSFSRCLVLLTISFAMLSGCKTVLHEKSSSVSPTQTPTPASSPTPNLKGLWVMGNGSSGTETSTIVRIEQHGTNIRGILEQPAKKYAEQYGVKKGDLEFEGVVEGRTVKGKVHAYSPLEIKEDCPKLEPVMLKDFELTLAPDENSLAGWTVNGRVNVDRCQSYTKGRIPYEFKRSTKEE